MGKKNRQQNSDTPKLAKEPKKSAVQTLIDNPPSIATAALLGCIVNVAVGAYRFGWSHFDIAGVFGIGSGNLTLDASPHPAGTKLRAIPREYNISVADFRARYSSTSKPVIVSGAVASWPAQHWTKKRFGELCGSRPLYPPCAPRDGQVKVQSTAALGRTWGSVFAVDVGESLPTIGDLLKAQDDPSWSRSVDVNQDGIETSILVSGNELYLHDAPVEKLCPDAVKELRAPKYFPVDYRLQLNGWSGATTHEPPDGAAAANGEMCYLRHHPSIFIGSEGSQSGLHRDSEGTRFWMAVLKGKKSFRLLSQQDSLDAKFRWLTDCVKRTGGFLKSLKRKHKPSLIAEMCPQYGIDLFADTLPATADATERLKAGDDPAASTNDLTIWEGEVGEGELLFIPEGWAHQVLNLSPTIAISSNFVDEYSMNGFTKLLLDMLDYATAERRATNNWEGDPMRQEKMEGGIERLSRRIQHLGFEEAEGRFPSAVAKELAASDATWDEFFKRNSLEEEEGAEGEAARGQRLDEWLRGGGIGRLLKWVGAHPEEAVGEGNAKDEALRKKRAARLASN